MSDKIIDRIRKLLALATSSNVHEAAAAAAKAQELMSQHGIEEAALAVERGEEDGPVEVEDLEILASAKHQSWRGQISMALAEANGCQTYDSYCAYPVNGKVERRAVEKIVGPRDAAAIVRYMHAYLCNEVERLAREIGKTESTGRSWYHSFKLGAAIEIAGRIERAAKEERDRAVQSAQSSGTAIVRVNAALARLDERAEAVAARCKKIGLIRKGGPRASNSAAFYAGKAAGAGVNLSRGTSPALGAGAAGRLRA